MKISSKIALTICLISILSSFSIVSAQQQNGLTPEDIESPTTSTLNSVYILNNLTATNDDLRDLNAWAVGNGGTIIRWDGSSWTQENSPTSHNLYSVVFTNMTNGWAVGGTGNNGVILHYNGNAWNIWESISFTGFPGETDPIEATLYSVTMLVDGVLGWAVGADGTVLTWDSSTQTWFGFPSISENHLRSVAMIHGSADAWAVGDEGTIMHWNGENWVAMNSPTNLHLRSIQMIDANRAWAGGGNNNDGILLSMSGVTWTVWDEFLFDVTGEVHESLNSTIYSISMGSDESAWAVGSNGFVMHWTGEVWACNDYVIDGTFRGVAMVHGSGIGSLQAWTVGDGGAIYAYDGTIWIPEIPFIAIPLLMSMGLIFAFFKKSKLFKTKTR